MRKTGITLFAFGCLALFGCDEATVAPDSQASFDEASAQADTDRSARRGRFGRSGSRMIEAIKEQGDEQALALLETAEQEREAARTAMEAGDEESARTHMEASREAMHEAVTIAYPEYAERMEQARERWNGERPEGMTRAPRESQGRMHRMRFDESRMQSMIDGYLENNPENAELIEQAKLEMEAMRAAMEAGDEDAAREHGEAMRKVMQRLRPNMHERTFERGFRGRLGVRRQ
jgi:hypothetical protein